MIFYVYLWLRYDGTPYYVGKGKDYRAWVSHVGHRPPPDQARILVEYYDSEADAFVAEEFLISFYGRKDTGQGILRNLTDGGDGASGVIRSETFRAKVAAANLGRKDSPARRKKISDSHKNHPNMRKMVEYAASHRKGVASWNKGISTGIPARNRCTKESMVGQRFGKWKVLRFAKIQSGQSRWVCQCTCRTIREVSAGNLRHGSSLSCGCTRHKTRSQPVGYKRVGIKYGR